MKIVMKPLDELGYVGRGKSKHRPRDAAHLYDGPYPFIQTSDVKNAGLYITEYTQTYSAAGLAQSKLWKPGTLCITIAANIADTAILSFDACFPDSIIGFIPDPKKSDARYIKYLFDTVIQQRFKKFTQGVAQDNLSQEKLLSLKLPVAEDVNDQRVIADKISIYDNLINTNRRQIQLLEELARLLFREWFVYFKFSGHERVKIVDGVPEGWKKVPLSELVDFKEGPGLRNHQFRDEGIPFLNIRTFGDDEIDLSKVGYLDETEVYEKYKHFLLKEDDHVISSSGTLGRLVTIRTSHLPLMLNTSLIRMRPKQPMKKWMLKAYLLYGGFIEKASSLAIGAAQLNFGPAHINKMRILLPKNEVIDEFEKHISMIYLAKKNLLDQNQNLAQARVLLLPRLMSGAIEV
jgi:type I restriction enzyme, S subunit